LKRSARQPLQPRVAVQEAQHINLCTRDVASLSAFLVAHFGYNVLRVGKGPPYDGAVGAEADFAMLDGADESSLVLTQIVPPGPSSYSTTFHFGITMTSPEEVYAKYMELTDAGHDPESFEAVGAAWTTFPCALGDGLTIEVNYRLPAYDHDIG